MNICSVFIAFLLRHIEKFQVNFLKISDACCRFYQGFLMFTRTIGGEWRCSVFDKRRKPANETYEMTCIVVKLRG